MKSAKKTPGIQPSGLGDIILSIGATVNEIDQGIDTANSERRKSELLHLLSEQLEVLKSLSV